MMGEEMLAPGGVRDDKDVVCARFQHVSETANLVARLIEHAQADQLIQIELARSQGSRIPAADPQWQPDISPSFFRGCNALQPDQRMAGVQPEAEHSPGLLLVTKIHEFHGCEVLWIIGEELHLELAANTVRADDFPHLEPDRFQRGSGLWPGGLDQPLRLRRTNSPGALRRTRGPRCLLA